jgi:hypothetical protein
VSFDTGFASAFDTAGAPPDPTDVACDPWPMTGCWTPPPTMATALVDEVWTAACDAVWSLTGGRLGVCSYTAWFGTDSPGDNCLPVPVLWRGAWYNLMLGPGGDCCRVRLDPGPVLSVTQVLLDGALYADWALDGDWLVNLNGCWPVEWPCQLRRFRVSWRAGEPVEGIALLAAGEMAEELTRACSGDPSCRLPSNVTTITRLGVTITLGDPSLLLSQGFTGMPLVDLAIRTYNPAHLVARSRVYSPDVARPQFR